MASIIGNVVKVDYSTTDKTKGKFARVAVVVDISKPLVLFIGVDGKKQMIVYKGLSSIYYNCDKVDHIKENCSQSPKEQVVEKSISAMEETVAQNQTIRAGESNPNTTDQDLYNP